MIEGAIAGFLSGCGLWISSQATSSTHAHGHLKSGFQCGAPGILGAALVEEDLVYRNPPTTHLVWQTLELGTEIKISTPIPH